MAFGAMPVNDNVFDYSIYVEGIKDQVNDDNELKFKNVRGARFGFGQTSHIGINLLAFTEVDIPARGFRNANYRMAGVDFAHTYQGVEFLGEAFKRWDTNNKEGGSGAYVQAAVPISALPDWYLITRVETLHRPNEGHASRWVVGATWRMKPAQLLKFEFTGGSADLPESPRGFLGSFAILF